MQSFDKQAYEAWLKRIEDVLPDRVVCPDCNGTGDGECPHCGSMTDCETCDGDGKVRPSAVISPAFYRRVMMFEQQKFEHWAKGDPIAVKDEKGRWIENHNPLDELAREFLPRSISTAPKIVLCLPITE